MYPIKELEVVEETKHLVPNLAILAKALFGENSYLIPKAPHQSDWATQDIKIGDGLLWLPWKRQLWLIEIEWKEGSNFFHQSRAFAEGKVDEEKLFNQLHRKLKEFKDVLIKSASDLREGIILENIVKQTFKNHVLNGYLRPHGWIILGHGKDNRDKLQKDYEKELKARFNDKHYILSMARMFVGKISSYILLEQFCSKGCEGLIQVEKSVLIPAITISVGDNLKSLQKLDVEKTVTSFQNSKSSTLISKSAIKGRSGEIWNTLAQLNPSLSPENVRLRIQIDEKNYHDFEPNWSHSGYELMVFGKDGIHQQPSRAAREIFGNLIPKNVSNIARKFGVFIDISHTPPKEIVYYKDIEKVTSNQMLTTTETNIKDLTLNNSENKITYFDNMDTYKQKRVQEYIINRKELWKKFLEKKEMSIAEFRVLSDFKTTFIAGFSRFLTENKIAIRIGDDFKLCEAVIPHIKDLLEKDISIVKTSEDYFESLDPYKQRKIEENILNRKTLWEIFLQRRKMTISEFHEFSDFIPKTSVAAFIRFLNNSGIAIQKGDDFVISENAISPIKSLLAGEQFSTQESENYFMSMDTYKQRRIVENILNRKELWKVFIEKKKMTVSEFKKLSDFKPKAIAGFLNFLANNGIAHRFADTFTLSEDVIEPIKNLIEKGRIF